MNQTQTRHLLAGLWGAVGGASIGYMLAKKHFERIADIEIEAVKDEYAKRYKSDGYSTPTEALETLSGENARPDEPVASTEKIDAVDAIIRRSGYENENVPDFLGRYQTKEDLAQTESINLAEDMDLINANQITTGIMSADRIEDMDLINADVVDPEDVVANVFFDESDPIDLGDSKYPRTVRPPDADKNPYVISIDEYMADEPDYSKTSLQYYSEDDVLTDETDGVIRNIGRLVGDSFLVSFGDRSGDKNVVYVRNESRQMDLEISLNEGSFAHMVYGVTNKKAKRGLRFPEDE